MKIPFFILLAGTFAGCTSPGPTIPPDVRPIVGQITLGVQSVNQAQQIEATRFTFQESGQSQSGTFTIQSVVDVQRTAKEFRLRLEVMDASISSDEVADSELNHLRGQLREFIGTIFTYRQDLITNESDTNVAGTSLSRDLPVIKEAGVIRTIREGYMGGLTLYQGYEIVRNDVADLEAGKSSNNVTGTLTGRVVGRSTYGGRQAIVLALTGEFSVAGSPATYSGVTYVDTATGVPVNARGVLNFSSGSNGLRKIEVSQRLTIF